MAHMLFRPLFDHPRQQRRQALQQTHPPSRRQHRRHYPLRHSRRHKLKSCTKSWRKQYTRIQMRRHKRRQQTKTPTRALETALPRPQNPQTKPGPCKQSPPQAKQTSTKKPNEISAIISTQRQRQQQLQSSCSFHRANALALGPISAVRPMFLILVIILFLSPLSMRLTLAQPPARMVRLCIASVEPAKLSSQCVMCNRREFPLTVIDCTGITKVNDLIANPLSVQEAACLIYNCRRQVPDIKPEPYHGAISHAARHASAGARYASATPSQTSHFQEMVQAPFSSPSSATSFAAAASPMMQSQLPPTATSLATMFGSLPLPFSTPTYAQQPSMASYYAINNPQQQTTYQQASSVPYSMRYGPFGGGGYNSLASMPMQFVQQSAAGVAPTASLGPMAMDVSSGRGFGGFGFGHNRNSLASVIWPQSLGGATNVYDTATSQPHPSLMTVGTAPTSFMMQSPYSTAMMMSPSTISTTNAGTARTVATKATELATTGPTESS